jgi:hypothetical protein
MEADRPAARPPDTMNVRGRLRGVWLALWLAGAAGCVLVGLYGDTPEDTLGSHQIFLSLFLFAAAVSVVVAVRGFGRGLEADGNGVVVRNMLRARPILWRELAGIEFRGVHSEALATRHPRIHPSLRSLWGHARHLLRSADRGSVKQQVPGHHHSFTPTNKTSSTGLPLGPYRPGSFRNSATNQAGHRIRVAYGPLGNCLA